LTFKLLDKRWLVSWLRDPQRIRAGTIMPNFHLTDGEIGDIASFLLALESNGTYPAIDLSSASSERGKRFFTELGCRACHSDGAGERPLRRRIPNLADAGVKLRPEWVLQELEHPKLLNPDARIPILDVTASDTLDIIAYLTTLTNNQETVENEQLRLTGTSKEKGRALVEYYGCYGCHMVRGFENAPPAGPDVRDLNIKEKPQAHTGSQPKPRMPEYKFDGGEAESLTTFCLSHRQFETPEKYSRPATLTQRLGQVGEELITEYNCRGCHMLEESVKPRIHAFIGLKTYVPPRLIREGEKVQPRWVSEYLRKPNVLRPWLKIRMPNFSLSDVELRHLISYFSVKAASPEHARLPYVPPVRREQIPKIELEMGEYRVRFDKCMQCHPVSLAGDLPEDVKIDDLAINLLLAKTRLRFEWIKNFLRNPDKYAGPDTRMPFVYYSPEGAPRVSNPEMWIDYVAKYLMVMENIPEPLVEEKQGGPETDWAQMEY
jgi:mono/diheme cytochrome c family protein